ncbi:bacteriocin [Periweissella cryptocerci]|uniref:Bacteriocin n=1 Tax=Periweissella cryptocerci TaxID=2506420 RepID=A0A4P6YU05_9LACO|nr:bacteriocin [Periweissella cryptocerci]QBO36147.1 bacteriocin [Periweissella cryptocerci]
MLNNFKSMTHEELQEVSGGKFGFSISINISGTFHQVEDGIDGFVAGVTGKKRHYRKNS